MCGCGCVGVWVGVWVGVSGVHMVHMTSISTSLLIPVHEIDAFACTEHCSETHH